MWFLEKMAFFPKTTLSASKWQFLEKIVGFRGNIAVLRHLQGFLEKSEESRPPLKWPILGGLLSDIFFKKPLQVPQNGKRIQLVSGELITKFKRNCHFEAFRVVFGKK